MDGAMMALVPLPMPTAKWYGWGHDGTGATGAGHKWVKRLGRKIDKIVQYIHQYVCMYIVP